MPAHGHLVLVSGIGLNAVSVDAEAFCDFIYFKGLYIVDRVVILIELTKVNHLCTPKNFKVPDR